MTQCLTIERKVHFSRGRRNCKKIREGKQKVIPKGRVPRISRLVALALHMQELLDRKVVANYAELATLGHISRGRISQIMKLNFLATDIKEALLFLPRTTSGRDAVSEHALRPIVKEPDWGRQRRLFSHPLPQR